MAYRRINLPLLRNFAQNNGHLDVPRNFVVPFKEEQDGWLSEFRGSSIENYLSVVKALIKKGGVYVEPSLFNIR